MKIEFLTFVITILVLTPWGLAENPGGRVLVTKSGLSYLVDKIVPYLEPELSSLNIPEITGEKADCHYSLKNFKISNVKFSTPALVPGDSGLMLEVSGVGLSAAVDYEYHCFLGIHGSGKVDISTSDSSLKLDILINKDETGHPKLVSKSCSLDISNLKFDVHGSFSWLVNLFKGLIEDKLRSYANSKGCSALSDVINKKGNSYIQTFPTELKLEEFMEIDYSLVDNAVFTNQYLQFDVKGEFISTDPKADKPSFPPPSIPELSETGRMVFLVLSPYLVNTAAFVFQEAGLLRYNVTPNLVDSKIPIPFTTIIFQQLIPAFYDKYPGMNITFNVYSTKPPILNVDPEKAMLHGSGAIEFAVYDSNCDNAIIHAFSLDMEASAEIKVGLNHTATGTNITGEVESFQVQVNVHDSAIGPINATELTALISQIGQQFLVPIVNRYTRVGWPIPVLHGVELENLEIKLGQGYILVGSDIKYDPKLEQTETQEESVNENSVMKKLRPHVRF